MILVICLMGLISCYGLKMRKEKNNNSILSRENTVCINGIFVFLIFVSHSTQYFSLSNSIIDLLYAKFQTFHNQWIVTTFLTFSGFGVIHKIRTGGVDYLQSYPVNRILKTLFNFDVAVLMYLALNAILGYSYSWVEIAGSFIGLTSIGNSNWYIFTILIMYIVTYIAAIIFKSKYRSIAFAISVFCVLFVVVAHFTGLPSRFCSTVCCYALGLWIELYKDKIIGFYRNNKVVGLVITCVPIILTYKLRNNDYIMNFNSCFFVMLIIWYLVQFDIYNKLFMFIGKYAFSIYILQRIPMIIISSIFDTVGFMRYIAVLGAFAVTVLFAVIYDKIVFMLDRKILH